MSLWTAAARIGVVALLVLLGVARLRAGRVDVFRRGRWLGYVLLAAAIVYAATWTVI